MNMPQVKPGQYQDGWQQVNYLTATQGNSALVSFHGYAQWVMVMVMATPTVKNG